MLSDVILKKKLFLCSFATQAGLNLLQYTAQQGDITKVKELLSLGADIDAVTPVSGSFVS